MNKKFFLCKGFEIAKVKNQKLLFYHTPKCAGTTFCNIISALISNSFRIRGPLTPMSGFKNVKKQLTSSDNYALEKNMISKLKPNFIYGHIPFLLSQDFKNSLSISMLREPISRSISHYNFKIERSKKKIIPDIEYFFEKGIIPDNIIVRQFSGNVNKKRITNKDYFLAKKNLCEKTRYIFDIQQSTDLMNLIISLYDLPNIIFQNLQVTKKNFFLKNKKNVEIMKDYNKFDIKLYNFLKKNNLFYKKKNYTQRTKEIFLYWSSQVLINGKNKFLINKDEAENIIKNLKKNYFYNE